MKLFSEVSWNRATPKSSMFGWDFPYKPSIWGTPFMETPPETGSSRWLANAMIGRWFCHQVLSGQANIVVDCEGGYVV